MPSRTFVSTAKKLMSPHRWFLSGPEYQMCYQDSPLPGLYETYGHTTHLVAVQDATATAQMSPSTASLVSQSGTVSHISLRGRKPSKLRGYRYLEEPLEVSFHKVTQRWMFSSEIADRTARVDDSSMSNRSGVSDEALTVAYFALDDGVSWVQSAIRGRATRGPYALYCVDETGEGFRRQTPDECVRSHARLKHCKGRVFCRSEESAVQYREIVGELDLRHDE